jgi:hypothetical protein
MQDNELIAVVLIVLILTIGAYFIVRMIYKIKITHPHQVSVNMPATIHANPQNQTPADPLPPLAPEDLQVPLHPPHCRRDSGTSWACSGNTPGGIISTFLEKSKTHKFTFDHPGKGKFIVYLISWVGEKKFELINTQGPLHDISTAYSGLPEGDYYFWILSEGEFIIKMISQSRETIENFFMKMG